MSATVAVKETEWGGEYDPLSDVEDRRVLFAALDSFSSYRKAAHYNVTHLRRQSFYALPSAHWTLLAEPPFSILNSLSAVDTAIDANAEISESILYTGLESFGLSVDTQPPSRASPKPEGIGCDSSRKVEFQHVESAKESSWQDTCTPSDLGKAHSTLRQFYRDWSVEGVTERTACYDPVLAVLNTEYSDIPDSKRHQINVLVPGAGLGRLVFDICRAGYAVEGNEISYHQLLASNFILNCTKQAEQFALYPWAVLFSNHVRRSDQLQKVMIPDIHPGTELNKSSEGHDVHAFQRLSMSAADFCVAYKEPDNNEKFDAVATVFFIDTAPNLIAYIETISNCLKSGGLWINLGPLLWHFENDPPGKRAQDGGFQDVRPTDHALGIGDAGSVELTHEEVVKLVEHFGFKLENIEMREMTGYIQNPSSMMTNVYRPSFWVARKS